jgi:hypothetical protein
MLESHEELFVRIARGPVVLFLGQDYLRIDSTFDPLLSEILRKYGKVETTPTSYSQIFGNGSSGGTTWRRLDTYATSWHLLRHARRRDTSRRDYAD